MTDTTNLTDLYGDTDAGLPVAATPTSNINAGTEKALETLYGNIGDTQSNIEGIINKASEGYNQYVAAGQQGLQNYQNILSGASPIQTDPLYDQGISLMNKQLAATGYTGSGTANIAKTAPLIGELYGRRLAGEQNLANLGLDAIQGQSNLSQNLASNTSSLGATQATQAANLQNTGQQLSFDDKVANAKFTGTYEGQQTLDAIALEADTNYKTRMADLESQKVSLATKDYDLRKTALDNEKEQWDYKVADAKATNLLAMIDNGNVDIDNLTAEDRASLAEYKGVPMNLPFTSSADLNEKVTKLNFLWKGLNDGLISGDKALQVIADTYDIPIESINIPDSRNEILDSYLTAMIAANKIPDHNFLNQIFSFYNKGKETTDPDYLKPFSKSELEIDVNAPGSGTFRSGPDYSQYDT